MRKSLLFLGLAAVLTLTACRTQTKPVTVVSRPPENNASGTRNQTFHPGKLADMDTAIAAAIATNQIPGGVLWLERNGTSYYKAYGKRSVVPVTEPMTGDTLFDAASLTKVIATTPSVMKLVEQGKLEIDAPVARYLPAFAANGKDAITVRHLMTHTSGLRPGLGAPSPWQGYDKAIELACAEKLKNPVGTVFEYSDINFIVLGELVRIASGRPLNVFAEQEIFGPLKMTDTRFLPPESLKPRIAPTEQVKDLGVLRGVVHDPTSRRMGGVAGHAGLFTTASDLARYARFLLNGGELDGVRVLKPETVKLMTSVQSPAAVASRRGLGWDIDTGYSSLRGKWFPLGSYGHTGWTGTSIWIDPFSRTFVIFLSNRNHPTEAGSVRDLRKTLGTLAAEAVTM
ncbi:MAG TPA: serine hydrolase domain-containing protein, partial [Roseimicrobium sp.]|nr:serine hydrolase domain-containing protein [Roseimicrobium sp.]